MHALLRGPGVWIVSCAGVQAKIARRLPAPVTDSPWLPRRVGAGHHRAPSQGLGEESSEKGARLLLGKRGMALGEETE